MLVSDSLERVGYLLHENITFFKRLSFLEVLYGVILHGKERDSRALFIFQTIVILLLRYG